MKKVPPHPPHITDAAGCLNRLVQLLISASAESTTGDLRDDPGHADDVISPEQPELL